MSLPCTSAESGSTCQAHQGRLERELAGWGSGFLLFFHHPCVVGRVTRLVTCFCRFICRMLICSKAGDLATSGLLSFPLGSHPNSGQIIPARPLVWAPNLGLWKPASLSPCLEPLILLRRRRITCPPEDSKALPTSLALQPRCAFFFYPCLHQAPI